MPNPAAFAHYTQWHMNVHETRLQVATGLILREPPGVLLDLACSGGEYSRQFIGRGWKVIGLDCVPEKLEEAARAGLETRLCDLETGRVTANDASIDCVFGGEIIEHVVDTDGFLREIGRVLKPGGCVVLTTPNLLSLENRLRMLFGVYPRWVDYRNTTLGHVRAYSVPTLRRQLTDCGFEVEAMRGNYVPLLRNQFCFLDDRRHQWVRFTGWLLPRLSGTIIAKARKPRT